MAQIHDDYNDMIANLPEGHTSKNKAGREHIANWLADRGIAPEDHAKFKHVARSSRNTPVKREAEKKAAADANSQILADHLESSPTGQARVDYEHPIHGWTHIMLPTHAVQPFLRQQSSTDVTVTVGEYPGTSRMLNLTTGSGRAVNPNHPTGGRIPVGTLPGSAKEERRATSKPIDTMVEVPSLSHALIPGIGRQIAAAETLGRYQRSLSKARNTPVTPAPDELQELGSEVNQARDLAIREGGPQVVEPERIGRPGEIRPGALIRMAEGLGRGIHRERMGSDPEYREGVITTATEAADKQDAVATIRNKLVAHERKQATPLYYRGGGRGAMFGSYSQDAKDMMNAGASVAGDKSAELEREKRYLDSRGEEHVFPAEMTTGERGLKAVHALAQGIAAGGNGAEHLRHAEGLMNVDLAGQMSLPEGSGVDPEGWKALGGKPGVSPVQEPVQQKIGQMEATASPGSQQEMLASRIQARAHWVVAQHPMYRGLLQNPSKLAESAQGYGASAPASAMPDSVIASTTAAGATEPSGLGRVRPTSTMVGYPRSSSKTNHPKGYIEPSREEAEFAAQHTGFVPKTHPVQESPFVGRFLDRARGDVAADIQQRAATHTIAASIAADDALASAQAQTQRRTRKK